MKPFLHGKKNLTLTALRPPPSLKPPLSTADKARKNGLTTAPGASSASVDLVKEGDKIVRLVITCVCGERVEVECLYPPGT